VRRVPSNRACVASLNSYCFCRDLRLDRGDCQPKDGRKHRATVQVGQNNERSRFDADGACRQHG
jgi:hypothetical protein